MPGMWPYGNGKLYQRIGNGRCNGNSTTPSVDHPKNKEKRTTRLKKTKTNVKKTMAACFRRVGGRGDDVNIGNAVRRILKTII